MKATTREINELIETGYFRKAKITLDKPVFAKPTDKDGLITSLVEGPEGSVVDQITKFAKTGDWIIETSINGRVSQSHLSDSVFQKEYTAIDCVEGQFKPRIPKELTGFIIDRDLTFNESGIGNQTIFAGGFVFREGNGFAGIPPAQLNAKYSVDAEPANPTPGRHITFKKNPDDLRNWRDYFDSKTGEIKPPQVRPKDKLFIDHKSMTPDEIEEVKTKARFLRSFNIIKNGGIKELTIDQFGPVTYLKALHFELNKGLEKDSDLLSLRSKEMISSDEEFSHCKVDKIDEMLKKALKSFDVEKMRHMEQREIKMALSDMMASVHRVAPFENNNYQTLFVFANIVAREIGYKFDFKMEPNNEISNNLKMPVNLVSALNKAAAGSSHELDSIVFQYTLKGDPPPPSRTEKLKRERAMEAFRSY